MGLHIWFLEDYFEFKWTLRHSKSLQEIEEASTVLQSTSKSDTRGDL